MSFLHKQLSLHSGQVIEVTIDKAANVMLMDNSQFQHYRSGRQFRYRGGYMTQSPCRIAVPHSGTWHIVIDLGGRSGNIRHSINILG